MSLYNVSIYLNTKHAYYAALLHKPNFKAKSVTNLRYATTVWVGEINITEEIANGFRQLKRRTKFSSFDDCLQFVKFYFPDIQPKPLAVDPLGPRTKPLAVNSSERPKGEHPCPVPGNLPIYPPNSQTEVMSHLRSTMEKFYDDTKIVKHIRFTNLLHFAHFRFYEVIALNNVENIIRVVRHYFTSKTAMSENENSLGVFLIRNMQFSEFYNSLPFEDGNKVIIGEQTYFSVSSEIVKDLCDKRWGLAKVKQVFIQLFQERLNDDLESIFTQIKIRDETQSQRTTTPVKPVPIKAAVMSSAVMPSAVMPSAVDDAINLVPIPKPGPIFVTEPLGDQK